MSSGRCETQSSLAHAGRRSSWSKARDFDRPGRARRSIRQTRTPLRRSRQAGPEPSERDRTAPLPDTVSGMCQTDTAQPRTRGCSEHSPGNKALSCMRPILHPRAACVVGHWAKDELTGARGCRQARAMASMAPIAVGPVQTVVLTGPRPNGSMMSGRALHRRSNPTRWASGSGRGGERFARKRQSVREALDVLGRSAFRRPCAAGPAIPMATRGSRAPAIPDECLPRKRVARADRPGRAQRRRRSYVPTTASRGSSWPIPAVLGWAVGSCSASRTSSYVERRRITDGNRPEHQ